MKAYCRICALIQPSSFRPCNDAATGALYEDLCCDTCDFIVATVEERKTLAQPAQEPVAWMREDGQRVTTASDRHNYPDYETRYSIPLYTHPPQRTWVGLTDEEVWSACDGVDGSVPRYAKAIEAKLKEKNT